MTSLINKNESCVEYKFQCYGKSLILINQCTSHFIVTIKVQGKVMMASVCVCVCVCVCVHIGCSEHMYIHLLLRAMSS